MSHLTTDFIDGWLSDLISAWTSRDVAAALALFDTCEVYQENPFSTNAAMEAGGVERLWQEIIDQRHITITTRTLCHGPTSAVVAYEARMVVEDRNHHSSGIWHIAFRDQRCTEFHQWFMVNPDLQDAS
jgi:hypothetical protein